MWRSAAERRSPRRRLVAVPVLALVAMASLVSVSTPHPRAEATSIVDFAERFSTNDNGSIATFGNNLMVCPGTGSDCTAARAGTNKLNNNSFVMRHLDEDGAAFPTFSSSSAEMVLPDDAEVSWAGLYWGARLGKGDGGVVAVGNGRQMKLRAPGDTAYRTITAGRLFGPSNTPDKAYQAFAEVTSIVQDAGPGNYFGADVPAGTGKDRYAGWSLVIVYRSPSLPLRNLTVFDGLADVGDDDPQTITITGFTTPVTGTVNARIGLVAYEGDRGSTGDQAIFNGTQLATALSEGTNFFNGANDDNGTLVTTREPDDRNMLGFDIKNFDAPGILGNDVESAEIELSSTSERYFPGVVTTAIDVFAPDFSPSTKTVTNISGGDPAKVGDTLRYTVTFVNAGHDPAVNTSIEDPVPAGTTFVPDSLVVPPGVTGAFDAATNTVRVSPGDFPIGRSVTFTFDVLLGPDAANTDVSNQATIIYDGATVDELQDLRYTTGAAAIAVVPSADLDVTKVNTPATVVAGNILTSTITVSNDGPSPATDVVVSDELPAGLGTVVATASQGTCDVAEDVVTCELGTMAVGAEVTVTIEAEVPPGSEAAALTDIARVASPTADPDPDDNTVGATSEVTRDADLSVTKSASPATVAPGEAVTYTITATNNGPSTATSVVIDDDVPDPDIEPQEASSVPSGTCTTDPSNARCTIDSLTPGESAVMTVVAIALPGATPHVVPNQAIVSSATPDSDPSDDMVSEEVTVGPAVSSLTVVKTAEAPTPLIAGVGEVRYTIEVGNDGPSDADPVTVTDDLPPGLVVVSASTDRGECEIAADAGSVSCDVGLLLAPFAGDAGARAVITIVAQVPADVAPGTYENVATADAPSSPATTSAPAPVTVEGLAGVSVAKSFPGGSDPDITPGTTETYRILAANDGPSVAEDVTLADTLPEGLTATAWRVVSVTPPGPTPTCDVATVTCDLGDLPPGTTIELELDVLVDDDLVIDPEVGVANTADVTSATDDPNDGDNTSTFTASGAAQADVSIRKLPPTEPPVAGEDSEDTLASRTFTLEIVNFGPSAAQNLVLTDVLPPGVTFVRIYDTTAPDFDLSPFIPCTAVGDPQTVTCTFDPVFDLPPFVGIAGLGIEFTVDATVPDGTVLTNAATISADAEDGNPGNNTSNAIVAVRALTNLHVNKLVGEVDANGNLIRIVPEDEDPLGLPAGHDVAFFFEVFNDGPSAAADVQVRDNFELPSAPLFPPDCEVLTGDVVCRYTNPATGDLLLPEETFFSQADFVALGDSEQGVYTNTATVSTSTEETTLEDNVDTRDIEIIEPIADLIIDKTALTSPLVAGESFTYEIAVRAGIIDIAVPVVRFSSDAEDVVVADTLPPGLVPTAATSSQGDCTITGQDVTCELGTITSQVSLEPVAPTLVTITGTVAPGATGDMVENTAVATSSTPLRNGDSASATTETPLTRSADLAVTKVADSLTATAGGGTTFTITVTNTGPSDATNVTLTDLLPAPFVFSADGSDETCGLSGGDVVCELGTVPPGSPRAVTIAATLPPNAAPGPVTNTASVASEDVDDPNDIDNEASVGVEVVQVADVSVTKTPAAEGVLLGGTMAYTLSVVNGGPSDTTGVVLTETIPAGTVVVTLPPGCTGTGPVECDIGAMAAGEAVALELVLEVPDTLPPGPLDNVASVTSDLDDPDEANDTATATVEAVAQADVTLEKVLVTENPVAGRPVVYQLILTNNGPTVAPNASLSDAIPSGTTFVSFTATQGTCQLDEVEDVPAASCSLGRMEVGATATATLTVDTDPDATSISNTGFGGSGGLDEIPEDNEATVTTTLGQPVIDVGVTVTANQAEVEAGDGVSYTVVVTNHGPGLASAVVLDNDLPPEIDAAALIGLDTAPLARPAQVASDCVTTGTTSTCDLGDLPVGESVTLEFGGTVAAGTPAGTELVDSATVAFDGTDTVAANNTDSDTILVVAPGATTTTTAPVTTTTVGPGGGGDLPFTGAVLGGLLVLGLLLLAAGTGLRAVDRGPRSRRD